jgi:hypothetical protein
MQHDGCRSRIYFHVVNIGLTAHRAQGLLPTMMITYIGLDLGVDTSVVTNSASVISGVKSLPNINDADGDGSSIEATEVIFDIRRSRNASDSESVV